MTGRLARLWTLLALAGGMAVSAPATLRAVFSIGAEFQVNTYTVTSQKAPSVGLDADGDFVVVWTSLDQDGNNYGLFGQRFTSAGVALGGEFQVNTYTSGSQSRAQVAVEDDGDFVVVWSSAQDGSGYGIFARRFDSSGTALADELQVNVFTAESQTVPAVATDPDGDFVVAWGSNGEDGSSYGVFARRFGSDGSPAGDPFAVNTYTVNGQTAPSVAAESDGDFVVAWQSNGQDGDVVGVFGQRFTSAGSALGDEFQINTYTTSNQTRPTVELLAGGAFVVVWDSNFPSGAGLEIRGQRFDSAGAVAGEEFQVNTTTGGTQNYARVASDGSDAFVVIWEFIGLKARSFGPAGPDGEEFQLDAPTGGGYNVALDINTGGDMIVTWSRFDSDGGQSGVLGRRYATQSPLLDVDLSGGAGALTDGLLVLRHLFGFTGPALVTGAEDPMCMRCESTAIAAHIQSNLASFDIDGDGASEALTDGLLVLRYLFGFTGATLVNGVVDTQNCTRCDAPSIEAHIASLLLVP